MGLVSIFSLLPSRQNPGYGHVFFDEGMSASKNLKASEEDVRVLAGIRSPLAGDDGQLRCKMKAA